MEDNEDANDSSYVIVSDDHFSKKLEIFKTTNFSDFYQKILDYFPGAFNYPKKLFYYEAYSHDKKDITNEEEFIIANKKCIEFFYFCPNYSNYCLANDDEENANYLKYHSVIIFCPIEIINTETQKNVKKKMKIIKAKVNDNNSNNQINNNTSMNNNNIYPNVNYNMGMNPMMNNNNLNYSMMNINYNVNNLNLNNQMAYSTPMINNNYMGNYNYMNQNNLCQSMYPMMNNYPMNNNIMNNNMINCQLMNNNMMNRNMINNNNMINYQMMNNGMNQMMNNNMMNPMINSGMNQTMSNNYMMNQMMNNGMNQIMTNNNMMNPMMNNGMNQIMTNNMSNHMMNNNINYQQMNNNMINPMINNNMNTQMNNYMINNNMVNPLMNTNMNVINYTNYYQQVNNNISQETLQLFFNNLQTNPHQALLMMNQMNPYSLNNFLKELIQKSKMQFNKFNNNVANNSNQNAKQNENILQEYDILDTETNPMNKFIENAINISYIMKQQVIKQKATHPDIFINITNTLSTPGLLTDVQPSDEDYKYILCLIGKILENNGITVGIYKENNIKDRIDLAAIQFIFSGLISKKKFKLLFEFTEDEIICIKFQVDYKKVLIDEWKDIISKKLNVNKKLLILTNVREEENKYYMDLAFNPEVTNINTVDENSIKQKLIEGKLKDCKMMPLLEGCRLSSNIFDQNYNSFYSKNNQRNNQKRGNEEYIPPYDWAAYGININGKYDFGDNTWLGNVNQEGEFAVAYYGVNNLFHNNIEMIQNIISFMGNLESGKTFMNEVNIRKPTEKCMAGAYFYKNPEIAENSSEIINIGGFDYKIMFMCRVNSKKIRQPENFPELWILSPTPNEIRPYKILIKKIAKSSLANASQLNIKVSFEPPPATYYQILQTKDESYFNGNTSGISNLDYVLKDYTGCLYSSLNNYLRNGITPNNNTNSTIWCLHKAITQNNSNVNNGVILYRGVCKKLPNNIRVGNRFYFPEFISTSKDINVAKSFGGSGTLMYIKVENNGINGKKVYCRDLTNISSFPHEQEILFTSYCRFRVTKIEQSGGWDILHLTCEGHYF